VRALIDATALGAERGGDETMLRGVIRGLGLAAVADDRFTILADPSVDPLEGVSSAQPYRVERMRHRSGARHFALDLPRHLAGRRSDHDVVLTVTHAPLRSPVPVALMVQDLSFLHLPDAYPFAARQRLRTIVGRQARRAPAVLTVSEFSRRDLIESYGLDPLRVHVVPNAIDTPRPLTPGRRDQALEAIARAGVTGPFLLYLGNLHPRKNVPAALHAYAAACRVDAALADLQFVVAGGRWWGSGEAEAAKESPDGRVVFLGRVDDDVRQLLFEEAHALVYVSRFEGFGLPPLEAMAASTPVLAGDAGAIPEVTGGAALLVDPDDLDAISEGIRRISTDSDLRTQLVERGQGRVARYDLASTGAAARAALSDAAALTTVPR
jgi:glycosyltransferase involved in cell wall biosynthesis